MSDAMRSFGAGFRDGLAHDALTRSDGWGAGLVAFFRMNLDSPEEIVARQPDPVGRYLYADIRGQCGPRAWDARLGAGATERMDDRDYALGFLKGWMEHHEQKLRTLEETASIVAASKGSTIDFGWPKKDESEAADRAVLDSLSLHAQRNLSRFVRWRPDQPGNGHAIPDGVFAEFLDAGIVVELERTGGLALTALGKRLGERRRADWSMDEKKS